MKFDVKLLGYISYFEKVTKTGVRDAFFDKNNVLVFVVNQGEIGKAIGKKGINIKKIANAMKKRIKIIEFNSDAVLFVKNCIMPLKCGVEISDKKITIKCETRQERGIIIGRDRVNLNALKDLVGKFFSGYEITVE